MRAIQGALIVGSTVQIVLGYSQLWAIFSTFFSPLNLVALVGFGLFDRGFPVVGRCVEIGVPVLILFVAFFQQLNAFELVKELGMAVEIKMDYVKGTDCLVKAEEIERGIRCLMQEESEMRKKAKEMKGICRKATAKGGSSYTSVGQFIEDLIDSGALN